ADAGQTVVLVAETPDNKVQWYDADGLIYGAEEKRFTVTFDGVYQATAVGTCGESERSAAITVELTGNERLTAFGAPQVYPNPARTDVVIRFDEGRLQAIRIISMAGREVWRATDLQTSETVISVRDLENGMYILKLETDKGVYSAKLQVVR
ncbi:MAG: T9SS type A sorting domain-containing protein, partial [Bacteroidales bacterium]|nr:T9SS type A sorting domain-containing protein [Bacteroidales bacterium]